MVVPLFIKIFIFSAKIWKRDRKVDIVKDNLKEIAARMEMFPTDVSAVIINMSALAAWTYYL